jgi:hypothetical protein
MNSNESNKSIIPRNSTSYPQFLSTFLSKVEHTEAEILQYHQIIVKKFFTNDAALRSKGLLIFHGTGTGKTMLAIAIADALKEHRHVVLLSAKSLANNFKKEIIKYDDMMRGAEAAEAATDAAATDAAADAEATEAAATEATDAADAAATKGAKEPPEATEIFKHYSFISSNASNMLTQLAAIGKDKEQLAFEKTLEHFANVINLEGKLLIVDEAQNLFNGIVSGSTNATGLYRAIMNTSDLRIVFLSATPIINDPFELVPMFNMLHGSRLLPEDYETFNEFYVDRDKLSVKNKELFKNRIYGLVSYYGDWYQTGGIIKAGEVIRRPNFPDQLPLIVEHVPMSNIQFSAYSAARDMETRVRQKKTVTVETLQKPKSDPSSTYRVASRQISNFLLPDVLKIKKMDANGIAKTHKLIENLGDEQLLDLDNYSPKMAKIIENIDKHTGLCVVYSSFVSGEGLKIFSMALSKRGWAEYKKELVQSQKRDAVTKTYAFITGDVSADDRDEILKVFNDPANRDGSSINLILLSGAGAEGLDLKNVNSIHIMEPYWNFGRLEQIIARAVRYRSHDDYPIGERKVQPYIYLSDYPTTWAFKPSVDNKTKKPKEPEKTTDVYLYQKSIKAKILTDRFYAAMLEASIDCAVHRKNSPLDVQKKIDCLACIPTGNPLFQADFELDLKLSNPCIRPTTQEIKAKEVVYNGTTYYYTRSSTDGSYHIYMYKSALDSYIELDHDYEDYTNIVNMLNQRHQ